MQEIERKFLVTGDAWREQAGQPASLSQGYLNASTDVSVRVRIADGRATLNVKGPAEGITRPEFEYEIPREDAEAMLDLTSLKVVKRRYELRHEGMLWEIDEFLEENEGLVVAEIELESEQQDFARPDWLGREVSRDPRYLNVRLAQEPYGEWEEASRRDAEAPRGGEE